jgi:F-type H+-transporting ATPase subunit a
MTLVMQMPNMLAAMDPTSHVRPHDLLGPINNLMVLSLLAAVLVYAAFNYLANRMRPSDDSVESYVTKGPLAQMLEAGCVFVRENIARPQLGKKTDKYIYYVWTVFFFVLFCNLLGMIPFGAIAGVLTYPLPGGPYLTHLSGTPTSNLGVTAPLATLSFIAILAIGVREDGIGYFKHFAPIPLKPWPMAFIGIPLIFLEALSLVIKCCVLAMRLFGVIMAGHIALAALIGLIFAFPIGYAGYVLGLGVVAGATAISLLELFIALIQAFIFAFLTVLFIASGLHEEHEEHHDYDENYEGEPEHGIEPVAHSTATA